MAAKGKTIRILLLGDQGVGKSTFISAIIGENHSDTKKVYKTVVLPPSMCASPTEVYTQLVDTDINNKQGITEQLGRSHIIVLFYDVSNEWSIERLNLYWMPFITTHNNKIPIIIAGNKMDKNENPMKNDFHYRSIKDILKPIIRKYRQVQRGLECSAYYNKYLGTVLSCAQRTVLYPLTPLYDIATKELTENFKKALIRIFRILDEDGDGYLSDKEIKGLQERVFHAELQSQGLRRIKQIVKVELQQYDMNMISQEGFLTLQKKCIELLDIPICWSILRHFGYDDNLVARRIPNKIVYDESSGSTIELKQKPVYFLRKLFKFKYYDINFQKDKTSERLIDSIFMPYGEIPIDEFKNLETKKKLELSDFIIAWHYFTLQDYSRCYDTLVGIGYEGSLQSTFVVRPPKSSMDDMTLIKHRNTLLVTVLDSGNGVETKYLNALFANECAINFGVKRIHYIYSTASTSKILFLQHVSKDKLASYFQIINKTRKYTHYPVLSDIVVYFESSWSDPESQALLDEHLPKWLMRKVITREETINLQVSMDTSGSERVSPLKKPNTQKLFDLIWPILENPAEGYSRADAHRLRSLNRGPGKLFKYLGLSVAAAGLGYLLFLAVKKIVQNNSSAAVKSDEVLSVAKQ